jgi:hypothetical protein
MGRQAFTEVTKAISSSRVMTRLCHPLPERSWVDQRTSDSPNIASASVAPPIATATWAGT